MADWLNETFRLFDSGMFNIVNGWAKSAGDFLTPFFKFISFFGADGLFFIILSLVLILFKRTRRFGGIMLCSIAIGALFTNILIKNIVARPRPYTNSEYTPFWNLVGSPEESEYSFPSGHATVTMASMTALFLTFNKKWSFTGYFFVIIMAISRVYLIVHYLTDVIAGIIIGGIAGTAGYYIAKAIYSYAERNQNKKFFDFAINFDAYGCVKNLFSKNKVSDIEETESHEPEDNNLKTEENNTEVKDTDIDK